MIQQFYFRYIQIVMKFHAWFQSKYNHHFEVFRSDWKHANSNFTLQFFLHYSQIWERGINCSCISYWKWFTLEFKSIKCEICEFMKRIWRLVKSDRSIHLCVCSDSKNNSDYKCHRNKIFSSISIRRMDGSLWECILFIALSKASCRGIFTA